MRKKIGTINLEGNQMAITNKERVAAYKTRLKEKGFISLTVQVHDSDKELVKKFVKELKKRRIDDANIH